MTTLAILILLSLIWFSHLSQQQINSQQTIEVSVGFYCTVEEQEDGTEILTSIDDHHVLVDYSDHSLLSHTIPLYIPQFNLTPLK